MSRPERTDDKVGGEHADPSRWLWFGVGEHGLEFSEARCQIARHPLDRHIGGWPIWAFIMHDAIDAGDLHGYAFTLRHGVEDRTDRDQRVRRVAAADQVMIVSHFHLEPIALATMVPGNCAPRQREIVARVKMKQSTHSNFMFTLVLGDLGPLALERALAPNSGAGAQPDPEDAAISVVISEERIAVPKQTAGGDDTARALTIDGYAEDGLVLAVDKALLSWACPRGLFGG
jgi:hypothetical protein